VPPVFSPVPPVFSAVPPVFSPVPPVFSAVPVFSPVPPVERRAGEETDFCHASLTRHGTAWRGNRHDVTLMRL
jgi:hypothetical protein